LAAIDIHRDRNKNSTDLFTTGATDNCLLRYERAEGVACFQILLNMGNDLIPGISENGVICMSNCLDREGWMYKAAAPSI
jgi:hypothetical protein